MRSEKTQRANINLAGAEIFYVCQRKTELRTGLFRCMLSLVSLLLDHRMNAVEQTLRLVTSAKKFGRGQMWGASQPEPSPQNLWSVTLALQSTIAQCATMAEVEGQARIPTPESVLRDLAKNASKAIPKFEEKEAITGVK